MEPASTAKTSENRGISQTSPLVQSSATPQINNPRLNRGLQVGGSFVKEKKATVTRNPICLDADELADKRLSVVNAMQMA